MYKSSNYSGNNLFMYHKILQLHLISSLFKRNIENEASKTKISATLYDFAIVILLYNYFIRAVSTNVTMSIK